MLSFLELRGGSDVFKNLPLQDLLSESRPPSLPPRSKQKTLRPSLVWLGAVCRKIMQRKFKKIPSKSIECRVMGKRMGALRTTDKPDCGLELLSCSSYISSILLYACKSRQSFFLQSTGGGWLQYSIDSLSTQSLRVLNRDTKNRAWYIGLTV